MYEKIKALIGSCYAKDAHPVKRTVAIILAIMMVFAILETGTRIFCNPLKNMHNMPNAYYIYQMKPNLSHTHFAMGCFSEGSVSTNQDGFRVTGITVKKPQGALRILCMGDSVTFGLNVNDDETYPSYLQGRLCSEYPGREIQVINTGCPGYTIVQGLEMLTRRGLCYEPDIIIAGFSHHEFQAASETDRQRISSPECVKLIKSLLYRSAFYLMLRRVITPGSDDIGTPLDVERAGDKAVVRVPIDDYKEALQKLIDLTDRKRIALIFLNLPNPDLFLRKREYGHHAALDDVVTKNRSCLIDLDKELYGFNRDYDRILMMDLIHLNQYGNKAVADIVADYMRAGKIITSDTR